MTTRFTYLTPTVVVLSFVSLLNDISSELLFPIMPVYLASIGYSFVWIGVLEGVAEATAGISKGYFGQLSDTRGKRLPFVQLGYGLSAFGRLILAFANSIAPVFVSRVADRIGKGIRTASRDAMLATDTDKKHMAKVFGFHRAFDTVGAAIGPMIALVYLHFYPQDYKGLFVFAVVPTAAAALLTLVLKERRKEPQPLLEFSPTTPIQTNGTVGENSNRGDKKSKKIGLFSFLKYWKVAPSSYRKLVIALFIFTLMNSSDVFLLLAVKKLGFSDVQMIQCYIFYNLFYALLSFPIGSLADRVGKYKVLMIGLVLFCITYGNMYYLLAQNVAPQFSMLLILFFMYSLYAACTESVIKAIISSTIADKERATAIGFFTGMSSLFALIASVWTGIVWTHYNSSTAFLISALGAVVAGLILANHQLKTLKS